MDRRSFVQVSLSGLATLLAGEAWASPSLIHAPGVDLRKQAFAIARGQWLRLAPFQGMAEGAFVLPVRAEEMPLAILRVLEALEGNATLITHPSQGPWSADAMTRLLQEAQRRTALAPGDPVVALRNDYPRGALNGQMGRVLSVRGLAGKPLSYHLQFEYKAFDIPADDPAYGPGFALSVLRAQHETFERVIVPLWPGRPWSRIELITAHTRASRQVVYVGDEALARQAVLSESYPGDRSY